MADLSARSVIASTLLGTVPPRLPGRLLVAFAGEFGIQAGTTRTALSRMVDRGELRHLEGGRYVDLDVRLGLYRRLSGLSTKVELEGFAAELIDRFGALPREVNTLLLVVRIKAMCKRAGIAKLDGGPKGAVLQFHNNKFAAPEGLVAFIQDQRGLAKIKDNKLVVRRDWSKISDKIKGSFSIAKDLAAKAESKTQA